MNATDQNNVATVTVQIRPTGDYGRRRVVTITIPAVFDLEDNTSTAAYYRAWSNSRNLPVGNPFRAAIMSVQSKIRLSEFTLLSRRGETFASFLGETNEREECIIHMLTQIFGGDIVFDTL